MTGRCSCGATLVENALFCHRCGKPQREDLIERAQEPVAAAPIETVAAPAVSSGELNPRLAARASLLAAIASFIAVPVIIVLLGGLASAVVLVLTGVLAVYLYRRSAGAGAPFLSARVGARMGWMTGVFAFLLTLVQLTLSAVFSDVPLRELMRRQMEAQSPPSAELQSALELINSTPGMAAAIGASIVFLFIVVTVLTTLGGALGAQFGAQAHPGAKPDAKS